MSGTADTGSPDDSSADSVPVGDTASFDDPTPADDTAPFDDLGPGDDTFDEVRQAAGAVVASLKWLIDATERVIEDPAAFSQVIDSGRSVVEAFTSGFLQDHEAGTTPSAGSGEAGSAADS